MYIKIIKWLADGGARFTVGVERVRVNRREALNKPDGIGLQLETIRSHVQIQVNKENIINMYGYTVAYTYIYFLALSVDYSDGDRGTKEPTGKSWNNLSK